MLRETEEATRPWVRGKLFIHSFSLVVSLIQAFQGDGWVGILGIIFGIILVLNPLIGVLVLPFVLGVVMLAGGIVAIVAAARMR